VAGYKCVDVIDLPTRGLVRVPGAGFDAELVAFGVAEDGDVGEAFDHGGAEGDQT
jgi:hypothetical protein